MKRFPRRRKDPNKIVRYSGMQDPALAVHPSRFNTLRNGSTVVEGLGALTMHLAEAPKVGDSPGEYIERVIAQPVDVTQNSPSLVD